MHNIESGNQSRYAIVTVDLNGLKNINDSRGHQMGDIYIQNGADAIRKAMEGTDFIGYRVGGDEFSVVLKDCDIDMVKNLRTESQEWQTVLIAEELRLLCQSVMPSSTRKKTETSL